MKDYKSTSPFPSEIVPKLLILSDENVEALSTISKQMSVYTFKVPNWEKAYNIGAAFMTKSILTMQLFKQNMNHSMQVQQVTLYTKRN